MVTGLRLGRDTAGPKTPEDDWHVQSVTPLPKLERPRHPACSWTTRVPITLLRAWTERQRMEGGWLAWTPCNRAWNQAWKQAGLEPSLEQTAGLLHHAAPGRAACLCSVTGEAPLLHPPGDLRVLHHTPAEQVQTEGPGADPDAGPEDSDFLLSF